jgi:hypothetical protein
LKFVSEVLGKTTNYLWSEAKEDESIVDYQDFDRAYDVFLEKYQAKYDNRVTALIENASKEHRDKYADIFFYYQHYDPTQEQFMEDINQLNPKEKSVLFEKEKFMKTH